jgi:hypothetical protein
MAEDSDLEVLVTFLRRVPGIVGTIGKGRFDDGLWWVKFGIDIDPPWPGKSYKSSDVC